MVVRYNPANSRPKDHRNCIPAVIERFFDLFVTIELPRVREARPSINRPSLSKKGTATLVRRRKIPPLLASARTKSAFPTLECASSVSPLVKNEGNFSWFAFSASSRTCARRRSPAAVGNSLRVARRVSRFESRWKLKIPSS